jgi:hypothetical protein
MKDPFTKNWETFLPRELQIQTYKTKNVLLALSRCKDYSLTTSEEHRLSMSGCTRDKIKWSTEHFITKTFINFSYINILRHVIDFA